MVFFYVINVMVIVKICNEEENLPVLLWVAVGTVAASIAPFVAISMLVCLHMYLIIAKRTTIELILENRKKNKIYPQNSNDFLSEKRELDYKVKPLPE